MINHCAQYASDTFCSVCETNYFVYNGRCKKSENIISKCLVYKHDGVCSQCEANHILSGNNDKCLKIEEQSCKTYSDHLNCLTCHDDKVLSYIDDSTFEIISGFNGENLTNKRAVCVESGIPNCSFARESYPTHICLKCNSGYYLGPDNTCIKVAKLIEGCETYYSDGICSECMNNKVLSSDNLSCKTDLSLIGENCKEGKIYSEPQCFICESGYFLNTESDSCDPCEVEGCAVCVSSQQCSLCKSGYYMDQFNFCNENGVTEEEKKARVIEDDGLNQNSDQSVLIQNIWLMVIIQLLINLR
jgi:hypothetical protein